MADLEAIEHKAGPLPIWVWGVVLAGGIGLYLYMRSRSSAASSTDTSSAFLSGAADASGQTSSDLSTSGTVSTYQTDASNETNSTWETQAIAKANTLGYSPLAVESAIEQYLQGGSLTTQQQSIMDKVLSLLGTAPEGISGIVNSANPITDPAKTSAPTTPTKTTPKPAPAKATPKPAPAPTPKPAPAPAPVMYQIRWGDTLSQLAVNNHTTVANLMALNPQIHNPNLIYAGATMRIR